ncbi:MAG: hypothetical protein ACOC44_20570 [Promethearchaeia archaeon]
MKSAELQKLFDSWNDLNEMIEQSMAHFNFGEIKDIRVKQRKVEDNIYEALKDNAPDKIAQILPDTCDAMEMGYHLMDKKFYFLMEHPDNDPKDDEIRLMAITIDSDKKVDLDSDFDRP